ncbi:galactitol-1-phosphate 5-dehydrogenase [Butyrivibrio sp. INlla21]|uniref:galactitol-1-phosphate 5-dehydrogenase n=1 Tax=Butyrivibrio sp. INlla21 TaxID=1520811 RepID=UPI0008EC5C4E|nr:galactitol-1-phosphate 5-dehydrogenase [Butyrivibrio sp. INlla21]SFU65973.1 L-iditol 2-dehydrogenase [Butyrivibrio sp. INlla21]
MKAQVLYDIGEISYADVEKPVPRANEALVKVRACGICGSDIPRIYKTGAHNMPLIPGHEFSGTVEECETAPELVGKRVGIFPLKPCMECAQCKNKHYEMCSNYDYLGSRCDGGFAEYVAVPTWNLLPIPDEITDSEAAMLEPMCVAVHAMRKADLEICAGAGTQQGHTTPSDANKSIFICGLGTIGLLLAMFLRDAGYHNIYCIYNKGIQMEKLVDMGFALSNLWDYREGDPADFVREKTSGAIGANAGTDATSGTESNTTPSPGADVFFECIGTSEAYERAVSLTAPLGTVVLVGNPASDMSLKREVYWKILRNQLKLVGTWNSSFYGNPLAAKPVDAATVSANTASDAGHAGASLSHAPTLDDWNYVLSRLPEIRKSGFSPENLITHRFTLDEMQQGLEIMRDKAEEYIKIMVEY